MAPSIATTYSGELEGIHAKLVEVEVAVHIGLHSFTIVGLGDKAVIEAKERVSAALKNSFTKPPNRQNRKITVNLAPADVRKRGSHYDLAIAIGYLRATSQIAPFDSSHTLFVGELALDGTLRSAKGVLSITIMARERGMDTIFVPEENIAEARAVSGMKAMGVGTLREVMGILRRWGSRMADAEAPSMEMKSQEDRTELAPASATYPDFSEIKGQTHAKRALVIAAAGGHNLAMIGSPGTGKSLLASAFPGILPKLTESESIEVTQIASAAGREPNGLITLPPFRAPHHTASILSIIGGGSTPQPGEITLAHRGVLFFDEMTEFAPRTLESLRVPLESGLIHIARAHERVTFPARFIFLAAMNPCFCGFYGDAERACICAPYEIVRYQKKISGPLSDRIDIQIRVPRVPIRELQGTEGGEEESESESSVLRQKVERAREWARERGPSQNSGLTAQEAVQYLNPNAEAKEFLSKLKPRDVSPRAYYRLLKTARTIADLEESQHVSDIHLSEAFSYRIR